MARFGLRRPTSASIEFAAKAAVAATLAMWLAGVIGLEQTYWAAISAVVATAGTLGASFGAAVSRISATIVGLLVGLAALALPVSGVLVSGATVFVALVVLPAVSMDAGARLGAATTLIVTAIPGRNAVSDALARGANVPLGCVVAVAVGLVFLPRRAAQRLRRELRTDVERAGTLAKRAVMLYIGASADDGLDLTLGELVQRASSHEAALRDAAREPWEHGEPLLALQRDVGLVDQLVAHVRSLVGLASSGADDTVAALVRAELERAAFAIARSTNGADSPDRIGMHGALSELDAAFSSARARRATAGSPTEELARLLSVIGALHDSASVISRLGVVSEPA
jgi:uncharacterized membrane protein YccC